MVKPKTKKQLYDVKNAIQSIQADFVHNGSICKLVPSTKRFLFAGGNQE